MAKKRRTPVPLRAPAIAWVGRYVPGYPVKVVIIRPVKVLL